MGQRLVASLSKRKYFSLSTTISYSSRWSNQISNNVKTSSNLHSSLFQGTKILTEAIFNSSWPMTCRHRNWMLWSDMAIVQHPDKTTPLHHDFFRCMVYLFFRKVNTHSHCTNYLGWKPLGRPLLRDSNLEPPTFKERGCHRQDILLPLYIWIV